ncbi:MAG: flagellar brake protein [Turicibacter sp.]
MKRKYKVDLIETKRIDIFLEDNFRVITNIKSISTQLIHLEIENSEKLGNKLQHLSTFHSLKAIYYDNEDVYLFNTQIVKTLNQGTSIQLQKPLDFYKVQRRQHVRSNWFTEVEFLELQQLDSFEIISNGEVQKNNRVIPYKNKGIILNLSGGGFELKVVEPIKSNYIACRFKYRGKIYSHFGIVRRTNEVIEFGKSTYRTGIEFVDIDEMQREKIIRIVFDKIRNMQGKYGSR